jgi:threonine dehydrogenase-like Zn-dependent dehydrogenase
MKVVIAGGGNVGTFIAEDLAKAGHEIVIVEVDADRVAEATSIPQSPGISWVTADACEVSEFARADVQAADVVAAVTGDDEDNLSSPCWPSRSSRCRGWWHESTTLRTSGCSTRCGAWTCPCLLRTC